MPPSVKTNAFKKSVFAHFSPNVNMSAGIEQIHRVSNELLTHLHNIALGQPEPVGNSSIISLASQLITIYERQIEHVGKETDQTAHEYEWGALTWPLLTVMSVLTRRNSTHSTHEELNIQARLNAVLVSLVNKSRPCCPPHGMVDTETWIHFNGFYNNTLHSLHSLYSQLLNRIDISKSVEDFSRKIQNYITSFRQVCANHRHGTMRDLRSAQIDRMNSLVELDNEPVQRASAYFSNILYTMGVLAARLHGFLWELHTKFNPHKVHVQRLLDQVFDTAERLTCDAQLATKPTTAILVTNNLFPFNCGSLATGFVYKHYDVQIVSEDTAYAIQNVLQQVQQNNGTSQSESFEGQFHSAALLAMKPTSGVKRNNNTANAEGGGNTAHKKSDVNSKESVRIMPSWSDKYNCWQAQYPHLLCTTRQKSEVYIRERKGATKSPNMDQSLENKNGQNGKRPLFYFYIRGTVFSPKGGVSYVRTLSLPFTIATRRNQDCQVQRMMSSYTATIFWVYGIRQMDGLILAWHDGALDWLRFVELYRNYFAVNAQTQSFRSLSDDDVRLLQEKIDCDDCRECKYEGGERQVTFKNVLCAHLRYEGEGNPLKFSIWRGLLEVLQIFQDTRTNVKQLWNDYILMGFNDVDVIAGLLLSHSSVMCIRISYVCGGAICISMRPPHGEVVHLEPIEFKKLQAKSIFEYIGDIAEASKVVYVLSAQLQLLPVSEISKRYNIGGDNIKMRCVTTNITHNGPVDRITTQNFRFNPLRITVVPCNMEKSPLDPSIVNSPKMNYPNGSEVLTPTTAGNSFEAQLDHLMKLHGKTAADVFRILGYDNTPTYNMDPLYATDYGFNPVWEDPVTSMTQSVCLFPQTSELPRYV